MDYLNARERAKAYFRCDVIHFMGVFRGTDLLYYSQIIMIISKFPKLIKGFQTLLMLRIAAIILHLLMKKLPQL